MVHWELTGTHNGHLVSRPIHDSCSRPFLISHALELQFNPSRWLPPPTSARVANPTRTHKEHVYVPNLHHRWTPSRAGDSLASWSETVGSGEARKLAHTSREEGTSECYSIWGACTLPEGMCKLWSASFIFLDEWDNADMAYTRTHTVVLQTTRLVLSFSPFISFGSSLIHSISLATFVFANILPMGTAAISLPTLPMAHARLIMLLLWGGLLKLH